MGRWLADVDLSLPVSLTMLSKSATEPVLELGKHLNTLRQFTQKLKMKKWVISLTVILKNAKFYASFKLHKISSNPVEQWAHL